MSYEMSTNVKDMLFSSINVFYHVLFQTHQIRFTHSFHRVISVASMTNNKFFNTDSTTRTTTQETSARVVAIGMDTDLLAPRYI